MHNLILEDTVVVTILVLASALPSLLYTFFYLFRPWTTTPQGRALMVKSIGNLILLGMAVAYALLGEYPYRPLVRLIGFGVFSAGIWYLLVSLLRSQGAEDYPPFTWARGLRALVTRRR